MKTQLLITCAVLIVSLALASSAWASWPFWLAQTATPDLGWTYDGRIYMPDATTLVPEGCLVQFILDTEGDGLDDPLAHFGGDQAAITAWVNAGADPSAFCDDQLLTASNWDGTSVIGADWSGGVVSGPGEVLVYPENPYNITNGNTGDVLGWRVWSLSPEQMATFCERPGEELWYTTGVEYGAWYYYPNGSAVDPWKVGWPMGADPGDWNFIGEIGAEVGMSDVFPGDPLYRTQNVLDHHLATCIPEPGIMLACAIALLAGSRLRRWHQGKRWGS